ncbi:hypothetical protein DM48_366 [Burkholderia gladioli]|uniref:Phage head morphogenesis domain-containing protein n=1 Tax=Burkholderia gladioli TaxID=28095 RepID=A0AAW3F730_BURGA|nr:hypothetical protein [Burkholderia gladioli]KGC15560.1 hypothetical protein DM48_366 [Burkholderia gladioli]
MAESFYSVVTDAIRDFEENGFDSAERLQYWVERIRSAAVASMTPESVLNETLTRTLQGVYKKMIDGGQIIRTHSGVSRFTVDRLKPQLRAELDRRMMVSRSLIKLNREQMVEKTVQRFAGWASSIPAGGSRAIEVKEVKDNLRKALTSLPFEERRVHIDQTAKFTAALNEIVAVDSGAIAVQWNIRHSAGYHNRPDHKEREGKIYLLRSSWAKDKGLVKPGPAGYYDDVTSFGEEVFCSCFGRWLYSLRDLPPEMLTQAGEKALAEAKAKIKAMRA